MDTIVLIVPAALISGYIGARIKAYLDRAKPLVSVSGCRLSEETELLTSRLKVPDEIEDLTIRDPWIPALRGEVSAAKVHRAITEVREAIRDADIARELVSKKLDSLPTISKGSVDQKIKLVDDITFNTLIDMCITGGFIRGDFSIDLPGDDELTPDKQIIKYAPADDDEDKGGYYLLFGWRDDHLYYKTPRHSAELEPLVKAFCFFHEPTIRKVLQHAKDALTKLIIDGKAAIEKLEQILDAERRVVVEVTITNRGRSTAIFSPWATLHLVGDNAKSLKPLRLVRFENHELPADPVEAKKQTDILIDRPELVKAKDAQFFTVAGRSYSKVTYRSIMSIQEIRSSHPKLLEILDLEVFDCQVKVRRADHGKPVNCWLSSAKIPFGRIAETFPALEANVFEKE